MRTDKALRPARVRTDKALRHFFGLEIKRYSRRNNLSSVGISTHHRNPKWLVQDNVCTVISSESSVPFW
jgi:hypothetical protein